MSRRFSQKKEGVLSSIVESIFRRSSKVHIDEGNSYHSTIDKTILSWSMINWRDSANYRKKMSAEKVSKIIDDNNFLSTVIATVEFLSLPVSIIKLGKRGHDFPIIYTNRALQRRLGFDRKEIEGCNCSLFQCDATALSLPLAIFSERQINIEVTTLCGDGTGLQNTMFIRPLFNDRFEHEYSFCVHLFNSHEPDLGAVDRVMNLIKLIVSMEITDFPTKRCAGFDKRMATNSTTRSTFSPTKRPINFDKSVVPVLTGPV